MTTMPTSKPPKLPIPLTPKTIEKLMNERPSWGPSHPQFSLYRRLIQRGFEIMYPPGRTADTPLPPQQIALFVAKENEDLDNEFGEQPRASGAVHVQAHARDGGKTEVADYWRAAPGQGGADRPGQSAGTDAGADSDSESPNLPSPPKDAQVARDPEKLVREWSGTWQGDGECVALVKKAIPGIGATPTWQEGEKLKGPGDPPLEPGTAIATFENGKYPSRPTGNHAAIVIEAGVKDGKEGYWVLDQSRDNPVDRRFIAFNSPSKLFTSRLENYSVIRKGP